MLKIFLKIIFRFNSLKEIGITQSMTLPPEMM